MDKMMIYKVHNHRIVLALVFLGLTVLLLFLKPRGDCLQVSIHLKDTHPYDGGFKRTRIVQALEPGLTWDRILSKSNIEKLIQSKQSRGFLAPSNAKPVSKTHSLPKTINELIASRFGSQKISPNPVTNLIVSSAKSLGRLSALFRARVVQEETSSSFHQAKQDGDNNDYDMDYYDDVAFENDEFEEGDFDYDENNTIQTSVDRDSMLQKLFSWRSSNLVLFPDKQGQSSHSREFPRYKYHRSKLRNITLINIEGVPIVEDQVYWSEELEEKTPKGIDDAETQTILKRLRELSVQRAEPPTWNRCGRPKNQYLVFTDGTKACARYRDPHQYLVQGEVLSFYLSRLLGIQNVPVVALANTSMDARGKWSEPQVHKALQKSEWATNTTVAIIDWIENLERDKMPPLLTSSLDLGDVISAHSASLLTLHSTQLVEILQWSDLIVFDYITGNYDRVASMQDAADKENKTSILLETVHNLVRSKTNGGLWLIDNESGLLDSYSLLYGPPGHDGRFLRFHRDMLRTMCVFRRSTVDRIRWLHASKKAGQILMGLVDVFEPLFEPIKNQVEVSRRLQERISEVHQHIEKCIADAS